MAPGFAARAPLAALSIAASGRPRARPCSAVPGSSRFALLALEPPPCLAPARRRARFACAACAPAVGAAGVPAAGAAASPAQGLRALLAASPLGVLVAPLAGRWSKLSFMGLLFFFMAYANSVLDSTKDTLVVTALGGAEQIPFLTVWAVLPASVLFVVAFSKLSAALPRAALFNTCLCAFLAFQGLFTFVLYPLRDQLAPTALTGALLQLLPAGLHGGVGVLHNWTFTLFYVAAELWGDVVLSLLFWGLANDITKETEAMVLYPLFGLGANLAQALAGRVLAGLSGAFRGAGELSPAAAAAAWDTQLRLLMLSVMAAAAASLALHAYINAAAPRWDARRAAAASSAELAIERAEAAEATARGETLIREAEAAEAAAATAAAAAAAAPAAKGGRRARPAPPAGSLSAAFRALAASPQIRCLAVMAVAQGLSSNVFQVAWKTQLRMLHPDPSAYSAFMGNVATLSACATGGAMLLAPALFRRLGWAGAASFTPYCMIALGWAFFAASIWGGVAAASVAPPAGLLRALVLGGACVYVFEKASKFSLFKPAEEMVYLRLSAHERTQGKAAVDVCATQMGKAGGSLFQQALLLAFGSLAAALPALAACHTACVSAWVYAVATLARYHGRRRRTA